MRRIPIEDVAQHNKSDDSWVAVRGNVYDVSKFIDKHPGGRKILLKHIGTDATTEWNKFHNPSVLETVGKPMLIGTLDTRSSDKADSLLLPATDEVVDPSQPYGDLIPYADPPWYLIPKSPYYNASHMRVRHAIRTFVDRYLAPHCMTWDDQRRIPRDVYLKAGAWGFLQCVCGALPEDALVAPLPGNVSPKEWDAFHEMIICDELCRAGSGGLVWGLIGGLGIGLPPILTFGSPYLKEKVVRPCISGQENICLCVTEPYAGSDVANIRTSAKMSADGQHYIVNGEKKWITNGTFANYFTVACRTGGPGMNGISLLLIERSMPGVKTRPLEVSGVLSSGTSFIVFEDVKVPKTHLIGEENKGFKYIMHNFNHERMGIVIQALRFSRVCFGEALKHAMHRSTFGKKLIQHDVIRHKLALMAGRIETCHAWMESLIYQTMQLDAEQGMLALGGPIALLKAQSTLTFEFCAREAAQIFGGLAYTKGGTGEKIERLYREVRAYAIPGGSEEIMLNLGIRQSLKVAQALGAKL